MRSFFLCLPLDLFHQEGLNDIAFLDILELFKGDAALVTGGNFLHAVLEPLKGGDGAVVNDDVVPESRIWALRCILPSST